MLKVGQQGIGKPPEPIVKKPTNCSGAEIIRRQRLLKQRYDQHTKNKAASSELPSKT